MIKISVVGNCQARPIAEILKRSQLRVQINNVTIVHLAKDNDKAQAESAFASADYIIAQQVNDNYPCEFVRTSQLKKKYGTKVLTVINLYFSGYFPDWRYYRLKTSGTLKGPLGDYHCEAIYDSWQDGKPVEHAIELMTDREYNKIKYENSVEKALNELREREALSDCRVTTYIEENYTKEKLFFSFNHPKLFVIEQMLATVLKKAGLYDLLTHSTKTFTNRKEPLGAFDLPINTYFASQHNPQFSVTETIKGTRTNENGLPLETYTPTIYDFHTAAETFYRAYDTQMDSPPPGVS